MATRAITSGTPRVRPQPSGQYPGVSFSMEGPEENVKAAVGALEATPGIKVCVWSARPSRDDPNQLRGRGTLELTDLP